MGQSLEPSVPLASHERDAVRDQSTLYQKIATWVLIVFVAALPAIATVVLISRLFHSSIDHNFQAVHNDQIGYWHEIATFNAAGFDGGYYAHQERLPPAGIFRFGEHGPFYTVIIGLISRLTGWTYATPIYINLALIGLAFVFYAWVTRINRRQILLSGLVLLSYWPVLYFIPAGFQESFHQAMGIILAGLFSVVISQQDHLVLWKKIAIAGFLVVIALTRYSWAVMFFPLFFLIIPKRKWAQWIALAASSAALVILFLTSTLTSSPGYNSNASVIYILLRFWVGLRRGEGLTRGWNSLLQLLTANFKSFIRLDDLMVTLNRVEFLALILVCIGGMVAIILIRKRPSTNGIIVSGKADRSFSEYLVAFFALATMLVLAFLIYTVDVDIRVFSPVLVFGLFVLLSSRRYWLAIGLIAANLLLFPAFVRDYISYWNQDFLYDRQQVAQTRQILTQNLQVSPLDGNPWCNTVYMATTIYDYRATLIPRVMGISTVVDQNLEPIGFPLKSKYVLLPNKTVQQLAAGDLQRLQPLSPVLDSTLFLNLDSGCPTIR